MGKRKNTKSVSRGTIVFLSLFILIGLYCIYLGIDGLYSTKIRAKDFISTEAVLTSYNENDGDYGSDYSPTYTYLVNNEEYDIKSRQLYVHKPELGIVIEVKYNPNNPEDAVIVNDSATPFLLFFGLFFAGCPSFGALAMILDNKKKPFNIIFGLFIVAIGAGVIVISGYLNHAPFSLTNAFKTLGFGATIPIVFLGVGLFQTIWTVLASPEKMEKAFEKVAKIHNAESIDDFD